VRFVDGHFFRTDKDDSLEFVNLAVSPTWWYHFERLFNPAISFKRSGRGIPPGHRKVSESVASRLERGLRDLLELTERDPAALTRNVLDIVHELQQPEESSIELNFGKLRDFPPWFARFVRDLEDPGLLTRPIAFWHKRSGRSPAHLARTCRECFGCSPTELLNRARIRHVKARLRTREEKIASVALEAGFENLSYFYRVFGRLEGCAPGVWLKREIRSGAVPQ
jgi:AraC-like DNA-binding protein